MHRIDWPLYAPLLLYGHFCWRFHVGLLLANGESFRPSWWVCSILVGFNSKMVLVCMQIGNCLQVCVWNKGFKMHGFVEAYVPGSAGPCGIPLFWIVLLLYLLFVFESHLDLPALQNNNLVQYIWDCHCVRCRWPWCYKLCGTCDTCLQYYMIRWLRCPSTNLAYLRHLCFCNSI